MNNNTASPSPSTGAKPWNDRNHVEFEGRVGVKPVLRITKTNPVASTTLYVTNEYDSGNERKKKTTRIPVIFYGETGKAFAKPWAAAIASRSKGSSRKTSGRMESPSRTEAASKWWPSRTNSCGRRQGKPRTPHGIPIGVARTLRRQADGSTVHPLPAGTIAGRCRWTLSALRSLRGKSLSRQARGRKGLTSAPLLGQKAGIELKRRSWWDSVGDRLRYDRSRNGITL